MENEIEALVNQYVELLPIEDNNLLAKSEVKASKFLVAIAKLVAVRDRLLNQKVKKDALKSVAYAEAINSATGSNAPTREANAAANPSYLSSAEQISMIDNQLLYIRTYIEIFTNAHLLYRSLSKNEVI